MVLRQTDAIMSLGICIVDEVLDRPWPEVKVKVKAKDDAAQRTRAFTSSRRVAWAGRDEVKREGAETSRSVPL